LDQSYYLLTSIPKTERAAMLSRLLAAIPNTLSLARLFLGLSFPWIPPTWRLAVVLVAVVTDVFDGAASRWLHATSTTGRILDPVADKVFILSAVGTLVWEGTLGLGEAVLVGLRDLTVLAGGAWLWFRQGQPGLRGMAPTLLGKVVTGAQFGFFLVLLLYPAGAFFWMVPTVILSGLAAVHYCAIGRRLLATNAKAEERF
jgi:phosphatidylglycerophosphate synthase